VSNVSLNDGDAARLIFSANEELGGGMRALANAQLRFDPTTGFNQGSGARPLFQGETRVGLSGGFGTVMLGRGISALQVPNGGNADPWGIAGSVYAAGFATDYGAGGEGRIDRGVWYTSPNISGLTLSASMSPFKVTSATNGISKTHYSIAAVYAAGPLVIGLGTEQNRAADTITQLFGNYNAGVARIFFSTARVNGGTVAEQKAGGTFSAAAAAVPGQSTATSGVTFQVAPNGAISNHTIGATIPMGAISYRVGYSTWNGTGATGQKTDSKIGLGLRYDLSKRTYVYSDLAQTSRKNNGGSVDAVSNHANTKNNQFDLGIRHSF
jgi:predicted porin